MRSPRYTTPLHAPLPNASGSVRANHLSGRHVTHCRRLRLLPSYFTSAARALERRQTSDTRTVERRQTSATRALERRQTSATRTVERRQTSATRTVERRQTSATRTVERRQTSVTRTVERSRKFTAVMQSCQLGDLADGAPLNAARTAVF